MPLHFNSSRLASAAATRKINEQTAAAQQQLEVTLARQKERVAALLGNEQQVAQLQQQLDTAQLPAEQQAQLQQIRDTLQKVRANPQALDQEVEKARTQATEKIKQQQQQQLDQVQEQMRRSRNQAILNSLLLSSSYFIVAGTGLKAGRQDNRQRADRKR